MMRILLSLILIVFLTEAANAQIAVIPDPVFKAKLLSASPSNYIAQSYSDSFIKIDSNNDGEIQLFEALAIKRLNLSVYDNSPKIISLDGIAAFSNLRLLDCSQNDLSSLNLNGLFGLEELYCNNNNITSLNVSNMVYLRNLSCGGNQLTSLDTYSLYNLKYLYCDDNQITNLIVPQPNSLLTSLRCSNNLLTSLNFNGLWYLGSVYCNDNQLTSLQVYNFPYLTELYCSNNNLTSLEMANVQYFNALDCSNNDLAAIVLGNVNVNYLNCSSNHIENLDLSNCSDLAYLDCSSNELQNLSLSSNQNLSHLICSNNSLQTLTTKNYHKETLVDFSFNPDMTYVCTDTSEVADIQNLAVSYGYPNCVVNSDCEVLDISEPVTMKPLYVYPNPADNFLHIVNDNQTVSGYSIYIYNMMGQLMAKNLDSGKEITVSGLPSGNYVLKIIAQGKVTTRKFIKR